MNNSMIIAANSLHFQMRYTANGMDTSLYMISTYGKLYSDSSYYFRGLESTCTAYICNYRVNLPINISFGLDCL